MMMGLKFALLTAALVSLTSAQKETDYCVSEAFSLRIHVW